MLYKASTVQTGERIIHDEKVHFTSAGCGFDFFEQASIESDRFEAVICDASMLRGKDFDGLLREMSRVAQPDGSGLRREGRLDHERARDVAPLASKLACRPDRPVAGVGVEEPAEHRFAVVARYAEPVDRAVEGDERGRVAVRDQSVVGDGL